MAARIVSQSDRVLDLVAGGREASARELAAELGLSDEHARLLLLDLFRRGLLRRRKVFEVRPEVRTSGAARFGVWVNLYRRADP